MNFLAHLHLASLANSSLYGNILADFVRGNPQGNYSDKVIDGIFMHRRVDVMTDRLPQVLEAKRFFREEFRRVAPITLDVVWDHFLALHWQELEPAISLQAFVNRAQIEIVPMLPDSPERFQNLNAYMWQERWLERYAELPLLPKCYKAWQIAGRNSVRWRDLLSTSKITTRFLNKHFGSFIRK